MQRQEKQLTDLVNDIASDYEIGICFSTGKIDENKFNDLRLSILKYLSVEHPEINRGLRTEIESKFECRPEYKVTIGINRDARVYISFPKYEPYFAFVGCVPAKMLNKYGLEALESNNRMI